MTKPHGRDCPNRCSLCRAFTPRRVEQLGPDLLVDGVVERTIIPPADPHLQQPRGQRRRIRGKK